MLTLFDDKQLFDAGKKKITHFDIPDAELTLQEQFFEKEVSDRIYEVLLNQTPWQQRERKMYDKIVLDPRLTAWYGKQENNAWTPELLMIKEKIESACEFCFDSVLLNLYRDGQDSVSWHSDKKTAAGKNPPIASVSFGETRAFHLRHKFNKEIKPFHIPLTHGSFLLMAGTMQDFWEHHIPKTSKMIAPRINLTFRITE
ncbi:MAG: 2OG-Fe(II) oxygenase [Ferruginibacter sp.]|nr:2OG-Fe(II) oxygenase [Ferruginibacter sp.]